MPTPSGSAPDPTPPLSQRNAHFSSCPDPEDDEQQPQQQQPTESLIAPASPSTSSSQTLGDSQESRSSSWRPVSSSSQSQYDLLAAAGEGARPRSVLMSPMSSSLAAALEAGSGGYEMAGERRRMMSLGILGTQSMEMDDDDDGQKDDDDDDMHLDTSPARREILGNDEDGSDSESSSLGPPVVRNPQEHLRGLIRRIDELNARDAARDAERAALFQTGESTSGVPRTSRLPADLGRSRSAVADYGPSSGADASSSTQDDGPEAPAWGAETSMLGMGYEYADPRVIPVAPSTYLRPGSRFRGTQQSERQRYDVQVEIKHVDLRESFLCGYLRIQGLTEDHPTLTTYFEGEIIGTKYGFNTQHPLWGASDKTDLSHWSKFQAFRPFQKQMKKGASGSIVIKDVANRENIFMRWKEHFLVPDHRVRTIHGASFEGFYYICFNQLRGEVSGIYFHSKSEKFQQLELKHVEDKGCYGAVEFR